MTWRGSIDTKDRIFAALPYLLPLISALEFGVFLIRQFPFFGIILIPLLPIVKLMSAIPFASFIIFLALYMGVVRNERISHFIRFNTLQAILIDILLFLISLVFGFIAAPLAGSLPLIVETLANVIFLGALAACGYSMVQSFLGRYAEIPAFSEAVRAQVP
ncbi:Tic20 family protein [Oscillatoria sp. FACHB-1406]|uniref:Tic20 family protein n=1 Tax=Oscillatoria sp. FACHB-1406 TaxID=2692846 RepID=UPI00168718BD|nr:hypothetical protein [Oscillatoria sp. FACHB-1406]